MARLPAPWERQRTESPQAYLAFTTYRDLGPGRSITAAADRLGRVRQTLAEWSARYGWVDRVAAWDAEQDRVLRQAQLAEVRNMAARHARQSQLAQQAAMIPLEAVLRRVAEERAEGRSDFLDSLLAGTPAQALDLALAAAVKLPALQQAERLARGEPTEIVAAAVAVAPEPADLAAVLEALSRAGLMALPGGPEGPADEPEPEPGLIPPALGDGALDGD